jgi:hypothetical protein
MNDFLYEIGIRLNILSWSRLTGIVSLHFDKGTGIILPDYVNLHKRVFEFHLIHDFRSQFNPTAPEPIEHESMSGFFSRLFRYMDCNHLPPLSLIQYRLAYQAARIVALVMSRVVLALINHMKIPDHCLPLKVDHCFLPKKWVSLANSVTSTEQTTSKPTTTHARGYQLGYMFPDGSARYSRLLKSVVYPVAIPVIPVQDYIPNPFIDREVLYYQAAQVELVQIILRGIPRTPEITSIMAPFLPEYYLATSPTDIALRDWIDHIRVVATPRMFEAMAREPEMVDRHNLAGTMPFPIASATRVTCETIKQKYTHRRTTREADLYLSDSVRGLAIELATYSVDKPEIKIPLLHAYRHQCVALVDDDYMKEYTPPYGYKENWKVQTPANELGQRVVSIDGRGLTLIHLHETYIAALDAVAILRFSTNIRGISEEGHWTKDIDAYASTTPPSTIMERIGCEAYDSDRIIRIARTYENREYTTDRTLWTLLEMLCTAKGRPASEIQLDAMEETHREAFPDVSDAEISSLRYEWHKESAEDSYGSFLRFIELSRVRDRLRGTNLIPYFDNDSVMANNLDKRWRFFVGS